MTSLSCRSENSRLLDKLLQMKHRLSGKVVFPPPLSCHDQQSHIAGAFLRLHIDEIIEAIKDAHSSS